MAVVVVVVVVVDMNLFALKFWGNDLMGNETKQTFRKEARRSPVLERPRLAPAPNRKDEEGACFLKCLTLLFLVWITPHPNWRFGINAQNV